MYFIIWGCYFWRCLSKSWWIHSFMTIKGLKLEHNLWNDARKCGFQGWFLTAFRPQRYAPLRGRRPRRQSHWEEVSSVLQLESICHSLVKCSSACRRFHHLRCKACGHKCSTGNSFTTVHQGQGKRRSCAQRYVTFLWPSSSARPLLRFCCATRSFRHKREEEQSEDLYLQEQWWVEVSSLSPWGQIHGERCASIDLPVSCPPAGGCVLWLLALDEGGGASLPPGGGGRSPKPPELCGRDLSFFFDCCER